MVIELNSKQLQKLRNKYIIGAKYYAEVNSIDYYNEIYGKDVIICLLEINESTYKFEYYKLEGGECVMDKNRPVWSRYYHKDVKIKSKVDKY